MADQLRAALDAERRSAAATQRRMVAENAELVKHVRELQGNSGGSGGSQRGTGSISGCPTRASPSRADGSQGGGSRPGSTGGASACST